MSRIFNPDIFREYDIRGIADTDLADPSVLAIARAFGEYLKPFKARTVTVGYDMRLSSPRIRDAFAKGLVESGIEVIDIGLCPTPALYFSLFHLKPDAGVMITASHNPSEFNGFKLCVGTSTIYGEEIQNIKRIAEERANTNRSSWGTGSEAKDDELRAVSRPIMPEYISCLKKAFTQHHEVPLKVVLDAGNATAGLAAPEAIRAMGCEVIELFSEPDGTFPNHHPDPTEPENLETLIATVQQHKADVGMAFDGDADRIGVVDGNGNILWGDQLMILFARDILKERPGATFVSEVKCSQAMYDDIRAHGGNAIMWKTGHSLIKAKMKETGAVLAGEMSGHLFFADRFFGFDDAIYAACRLVELLKKEKVRDPAVTLSSLGEKLPQMLNTPEIRVACPDAVKFSVVESVKKVFLRGDSLLLKPKDIITVDGVRAVFEKGWGLVRASNTQPVLVLRFEAQDQGSLGAIRRLMEQHVNEAVAKLSAQGKG